jgi:phosphoribosyl-ATP pyrophosphohydrolase
MLNKKLCAACVKNYEKELKKLNCDIKGMTSLIDCQMAEISILDRKLKDKGKSLGKFEMMVIKHDPKYNRWKDISNKVKEESLELQNELYHKNYDGIVDEALDLITVAMNAINKCAELGIDIESATEKHKNKLLDRGWTYDKFVRFEVIS